MIGGGREGGIKEEAAVVCECLCWTCLYPTIDGHEGGQGWVQGRGSASLKAMGPGLWS